MSSANAVRIVLVGVLAMLTGCQELRAEQRERKSSGLLLGWVSAPSQMPGPFIVAAIDRDNGTITQRAFVERPGAFEMRIATGNYKFIAFADSNRDGELGRNEPVSLRMVLDAPIQAGDMLALPTFEVTSAGISADTSGSPATLPAGL
jgi:hypothetical protein